MVSRERCLCFSCCACNTGPCVWKSYCMGESGTEHPLFLLTHWLYSRFLSMIWFEERALLFPRKEILKITILLHFSLNGFVTRIRKWESKTANSSVISVSLTNEIRWRQRQSLESTWKPEIFHQRLGIPELKLTCWYSIMKEKDHVYKICMKCWKPMTSKVISKSWRIIEGFITGF